MSSHSSLDARSSSTGPGGRGRAVAAALGYLLALGVAGLVFVWTPAGQRLDAWLVPRAERGGGYQQDGMPVTAAQAMLSVLGNIVLLGALLVAILLLGVLCGRWWTGAAGVGLVLGSAAVANLVKSTICRPDLGVRGSTTHNSFPSGHVTVATSLLLALLLVAPGRARWWLALSGTVVVSLVGSATMVAGWHRFSDTAGGVLLAAAMCALAAAVLPPALSPGVSHVDGGVLPAAVLLAAPVITVFVAAALHADAGLLTGMVAASGCVTVVVGSLLLVLPPMDWGHRSAGARNR